MNQKQLLFGLKGRIGRAEWWTASVILLLLRICLDFALKVSLGVSPIVVSVDLVGPPSSQASLASLALVLLVTWPHLALNVKRLHDRNIPAWPAVLLTVVV